MECVYMERVKVGCDIFYNEAARNGMMIDE